MNKRNIGLKKKKRKNSPGSFVRAPRPRPLPRYRIKKVIWGDKSVKELDRLTRYLIPAAALTPTGASGTHAPPLTLTKGGGGGE